MFDNCFSDSGENMPKNEESFNPELSDAPNLLGELTSQKFPSYLAAIMGTASLPFPMKPLNNTENCTVKDEIEDNKEIYKAEINSDQSKEIPIKQYDNTISLGSSIISDAKEGLPKKRGRKKKKVSPEILQADTVKRMERNRLFARENRKRKKEYIKNLEAEVFFYI